MNIRLLVSAAPLAFAVASCGGGPPDWIVKPEAEAGFAATQCVRDTGNLSLDRQVAVAQAREQLDRDITQRIGALDAGRLRPVFGPVAKPVVGRAVTGLAPTRVEYVEVEDQRRLCAMLTLEKEPARKLFDELAAASGENLDDTAREALYKTFSGTGS